MTKTLNLSSSYSVIGTALCVYDYNCFVERHAEQVSFTALREDLVFVQVEVLEGYLEDLLNLKISDEKLYIRKECNIWAFRCFELFTIIFAVSIGSAAVLLGSSQLSAYLITLIAMVPLIFTYYLSPRSTRRRMRFARVLSREIARRRGRDSDGPGAGINITDFFIKSPSAGFQGTAKINYH